MTPQEQQLLEGLTTRINQTVLPDKDPQAEQYLNQSLGRNPDALYILAQTVLVQQYALDQAKKQLNEGRQQQQQAAPAPVRHTSFLGSLLGNDDRPAPPPPPQQQYGQPQYAPVPNYPPPSPTYTQSQYGQPQYAPTQYGGGMPGGGAPMGGSGFLGSALRTAGTVAAGAIAFEGIEHLMHGFGEHAGYGGGSNFGEFGGGQPREEIVNNYYGDSGERGHDGVSRDIEDRRDDGDDKRGFADTTDDDNADDADASEDDTSDDSDYVNDGSSDDDGGSFDDSGSDDSN